MYPYESQKFVTPGIKMVSLRRKCPRILPEEQAQDEI